MILQIEEIQIHLILQTEEAPNHLVPTAERGQYLL
jgi:hypothetical protein